MNAYLINEYKDTYHNMMKWLKRVRVHKKNALNINEEDIRFYMQLIYQANYLNIQNRVVFSLSICIYACKRI